MQWWIWLVAAVALLAVEMLTPGGFYFLFFGAGAFVAGLLALAGVESLIVQALVFLAVSIAAILFFRKPLMARFQPPRPAHSVDSLVGETAILVAALHPGEFGQAELRGSNWKVRNTGGLSLPAGQRCIVEQVDGLTLSVRAAE
ncbi:MAG: NfeD family protein [Bryobacterales bacterium]|nr:NfeD family protein [Bryobacterales bacterium]